jgi:hypothetical protein
MSHPPISSLSTDPFITCPTPSHATSTYTYKVTVESIDHNDTERDTNWVHLGRALDILGANLRWVDYFQEVIASICQQQHDKALEKLEALGWNNEASKLLINAMIQDLF